MIPALALALWLAGFQEKVSESAHYRLVAYGGFAEGDEYVRLGEALYEKLKAHFGAEPREKKKLEIRFWETADAYKAGAKSDGVADDRLGGGGVYWTGTKRAYFWRQPSAYSTRHLFLHELTHQFHYLAVMNNESRAPSWYQEGLAEHFAVHRWDGRKLETGLDHAVMLEERIPEAVEAARKGMFDLAGIVRDGSADYGRSWAAVHYLLSTPAFKSIEAKLSKAGVDAEKLVLGAKPDVVSEAARRYLAGLRPVWKIETISWDERGAAILGMTETTASLVTRFDCSSIEAVVEVASGWASVGLQGLTVTLRDGNAELSRGGASLATAPAGAKAKVRIEAQGGKSRVFVDGKEVWSGESAAPGGAALGVGGGKATFAGWTILPAR